MSDSSSMTEFRPPRTPLLGFRIRWDTILQVFDGWKTKWPEDPSGVPIHLVPLFNWVNYGHGERMLDLGSIFKDIYYAKLDIQPDDEWHFVHPLGKGGFGAVALFEQRDRADDKLKDQVVVKTTKARADLAIDRSRMDLSREAAMMGQTNDLQEDGMVVLRQYKYYRDGSQWKYYFEYCPYGDLERLRVRYKAYGRYLPELFLWHLFYWLAKTLREYSDHSNEWRNLSIDKWGEPVRRGFLLHSDIKTQNILLGPPDPSRAEPEVSLYPVPRIADLGLAEVQSVRRPENRAAYLEKGTPPWMPPEVRYSKMPRNTDYYPFANYLQPDPNARHRKGRHVISSKANIWAVGAVMYSMISLQEIHPLSQLVNDTLASRVDPPRPGDSVIGEDDFRTLDPQYYSLDLRDLVRRCLCLVPRDRPDEDELFEEVSAAYNRNLNVLRNRGYGAPVTDANPSTRPTVYDAVATHPEYKVYYRANEIDAAPDNYKFNHPGVTRGWWHHYFISDFPWLPPSWGKLWPDTMPTDLAAPANWPQGYQDALEIAAQQVQQFRMQSGQQQQQQGTQADIQAREAGNFAAAIPDPAAGTSTDVQLGGITLLNINTGTPGDAGPAEPPGPAGDAGVAGDDGDAGPVDSDGVLPPRDIAGVQRVRREVNRYAPYFIPRRDRR